MDKTMKFTLRRFHRTEQPQAPDPLPAAQRPDPDEFLAILRPILVLLKDFAMDIGELDAQGFRDDVQAMTGELFESPSKGGLTSVFERFKRRLVGFIARQKDYILVREKELREIIDLLTQAMATIDTENRNYNQIVYEQSEKIEKLTHLDDIRKIKQSLSEEVAQMRRTISEKQAQDQSQVESLSNQIQSLNAELAKSRAESLSDGLTATFNRRAFDWEVISRVERNSVMRRPFSLLLMDIDDFKKINDIHGHPVGDRVLISMAAKCREYIRGEDFFARYGGEEFALILPGASLRNAMKKARHICKAVADTSYLTDGSPGGKHLSVTVSIGVTAFTVGDTVEALIHRVDQALYQAKKDGKNRVVSA
ncbi:MAG: diguanylate cyclase [Desulfobacterales bacterium]|nr:diguanylate cyclase [Desulfobacterales bacterium]